MASLPDSNASNAVARLNRRSAKRQEWFAITRRIMQDIIADMSLDPAAEAEVIEAFTGARLF